jgi:hypothetical protein
MSTTSASPRPARPLLIVNGSKHLFFVEGDLRAEYQKLPGKRWGKDAKAHIVNGEFFTAETCPERERRRSRWLVERSKCSECHKVTVRTLDISAVPPKLLPKSRPLILSRRQWTPARRTDREQKIFSEEIHEFITQQPDDLRQQIISTAWSAEGLHKLRELARLPWRVFIEDNGAPDFEGPINTNRDGEKMPNLYWLPSKPDCKPDEVSVPMKRVVSWEPDKDYGRAPAAPPQKGPEGAAVLPALLKGLGTPYASFEEAQRAGDAAQKPPAEEQSWVEQTLRRLVAEERARSK